MWLRNALWVRKATRCAPHPGNGHPSGSRLWRSSRVSRKCAQPQSPPSLLQRGAMDPVGAGVCSGSPRPRGCSAAFSSSAVARGRGEGDLFWRPPLLLLSPAWWSASVSVVASLWLWLSWLQSALWLWCSSRSWLGGPAWLSGSLWSLPLASCPSELLSAWMWPWS